MPGNDVILRMHLLLLLLLMLLGVQRYWNGCGCGSLGVSDRTRGPLIQLRWWIRVHVLVILAVPHLLSTQGFGAAPAVGIRSSSLGRLWLGVTVGQSRLVGSKIRLDRNPLTVDGVGVSGVQVLHHGHGTLGAEPDVGRDR